MKQKRTLLEAIRATYPNVKGFSVRVLESCMEDSPPTGGEWSYSSEDCEDLEIPTLLGQDRLRGGSKPNALGPVMTTAGAGVKSRKGRLPPYDTREGKAITRMYICEVEYENDVKAEQGGSHSSD